MQAKLVYLSIRHSVYDFMAWTPLSHRKMQLMQNRYIAIANGILSYNATSMNSIPRCNDIAGILPNK